MENPQEPSLIEYARFYGIARDFTAVDPLTYIDNAATETPLPHDTLSEFQDHIYETQRNIEDKLRKEKLNHHGTLRYTNPLRYDENVVEIRPHDESCPKLKDEEIIAELLVKADQILKDVMPEKLKCSRESMLLIQRARDCGSLAFPDLEGLLNDMMMSVQKDRNPSKSPPLVLSDIDETYYRSPSPAFKSLMLPSPASSGSFELELQRNKRLVCHLDSKTSDCAVAPNKGEGSHTSEEKVRLEHEVSLDRNNTEISTVGADSAAQSFPNKYNRSEKQRGLGVSQQIGDAINLIDADSSVIFHTQENECMPTACTSTQERSSQSPRVILVENCQIASMSAEFISSFGSSSVIDSPNPDSTRCQPCPMSTMPSSQRSKPEDHAGGYLHTVEDHGSVEDIAETASDKELGFTHEDVSEMRFTGQRQLLEPDTAALQHESGKTAMCTSPDTAVPDTNASSDMVSNLICCEVSTDTMLGGQKRRHEEGQDVLRKDRKLVQPLTASLANDKCKYTLPSQSSILGSLSTFMEARGRVERRQVTAVSPYFTNNMRLEGVVEHQDPAINAENPHGYEEREDALEELYPPGLELTKHQYPQYPQLQAHDHEQPLLFVSTALLKSHLPIIQGLERLKSPPAMIYRDYDQPVPRIWTPSQTNTKDTLPKEADIIVSPTAGIILTTLQGTTQLYLPGHKPNPQTNGTKCINSPLRERIFLLAPRYRYLYVFVAHGANFPKGGQGNAPRLTADRRLLASFTSLTAFCDSMSANSTISPILISPSSDTLIEWILALARKHAFHLPADTAGLPQTMSFTPVNATPKNMFDIEAMENETCWEIFLRRVGLNPYAAQTILTVLKYEREIPERKYNDGTPHDVDKEMSALSRFIEMSPERRRELFPGLIGKRNEAILEKDWQCDWALDFD
ncbi:hypothetical protein ANOM_005769 [Aspergillus nomiae NRRL 13137]|uniref:Uncharacterized protein n=1 Tax=Aspergillus nomiae NRRL (strain ATCC 15546 / NRRL 13137 / CBS 260.88 / M93) TaxID=1509407 RepID=A0A0L1J0M9_ASPN3|nr:uncharacterized protein ANOM_005769 [Aspergillus nomiae NRRL 13137]KNG84938.1 hypothetical protein ANOM_005769 [Aspergillus nomiae NRRL 13137]